MLGHKAFIKDILDKLKENQDGIEEAMSDGGLSEYEIAEYEGVADGYDSAHAMVLSKAKEWYGFTEEDIEAA